MIRILLIFLLLFCFSNAQDLKGKITYTVQSARIEAFRDLSCKIPKEMFVNYKKDKYYKENYANLKKRNYIIKTEPNRNINPFYVLNKLVIYSVEYENDINQKYYYNALGRLVKFEVNDYMGSYPYRAIAYNNKGDVVNITFVVSEVESFIFDKNEKLLGHWINNKFFDKNGKEKYQRALK